MKKILFLLSLMAALGPWVSTSQAQTIKVVKKQGQPVAFDVSKLDSITFQSITPGFTVYGNDSTAQYTFDKVESIKSSADFLFSHPDTIYVGDTRGMFSFQMNTNVDYDIEPSAGWLYYDGKITGTDSLRFISGNNPMMTKRTGYIYFVNKADDTMRDTLVIVQTGKGDSHFIDIDWATTTVNSFNETTGQCVLTFQGEVPEMGEYDAFLLPTTTSYRIRLVNTVAHAEGSKTVTLGTREGKMGNLFKNQSFTLCTDPNYNPNASEAKARDAGIANAPVFYPETIELCVDGQPFAEVYRRNSSEGSEEGAASALHANAPRRATELQKDFNIYELNYDKSGDVIWESGSHSVSWDKCTFDVGLKGVFYFNFGDTEWEKVRFGDLQVLKAYLEGDFNTELILKYALSKSAEFSWEKTLKEDLFSYRVKFMVGTIPVWINISSDLKASVEAGAEGTVTVTSGVTANANVKAGLQWDKVSGVTPINEFTYGYELVEPEVEAEAHAEAKAYVWPEIKIGIYDVLCPTINPKPYIRAYADARTAESNKPYFGWNAGVSTGVDLTLGLSLDLYFWEKEIGEIEPINLVDYDLVELPYRIERTGNEVRGMMQGDTCHVTYQVWGKNRITNSEYLIPGALLHLEKTGGGTITSDQMIDQDGEFYRTNKNGEILLVFTQNDTIPATVNATLVTGDEERDKETLEWRTAIKNYRLTAPDVDDTNSVTARSSGTADIRYLLEEYTKSKEDVDGHWQGLNGVNVTFKATGGSLEASIVTADNGGYATAKFDGGGNYDGNGTLEASAYIAAFDTTVVAPAIKIDEFKFDDDNLNKCYNLEDNTAYINGVHDLFKGVTIPVHFAKHEIEHTDYAEYAYISLAIYDDIHVVQTETCDGCEGVAPNPPYDPDLVYDYIKVSATTHWTETYTRRSVSCGYNNAENLPLDYVGINGGALSFVQENYKYTEKTSSTANYKYIKTDDEGKEVVVRTATTNGSSGPTERESYQWWNNAELCGPSQCTVFEEDGKIIYLYYVIDDEHKLYVKAVFDKEGNVH